MMRQTHIKIQTYRNNERVTNEFLSPRWLTTGILRRLQLQCRSLSSLTLCLPTPNFIASSQNLLSAAISGLDCLAKNTLSALSRSLHCESKKKQFSWLLITTSTNVHRFPKFFHWQNPEKILQTNIINISTSPEMFLHYLVKLHNYNCCRFQWHIARETLEFILQAMRLP